MHAWPSQRATGLVPVPYRSYAQKDRSVTLYIIIYQKTAIIYFFLYLGKKKVGRGLRRIFLNGAPLDARIYKSCTPVRGFYRLDLDFPIVFQLP
jgi:hypothetical protein